MPKIDIDSILFYVDEDLDSDQFVMPLRESGLRIVRHRQILPAGASDEIWIPYVARSGWFALSHNREISYIADQRDLVMKEDLGLLIVRGHADHEGHPHLASKVVGAQVSIINFLNKNYRPFIASIVGPQGKKRQYRCEPRMPHGRDWGKGKFKARQQLAKVEDPPLEVELRFRA